MCRALGGPRRVPHSFATAQGRFVRAFIAVVPPASIIQRIQSGATQLRSCLLTAGNTHRGGGQAAAGLRWVHPDHFHLTLHFLGAVEEARIATIKQRLKEAVADVQPFQVEIGGIGVFPSWKDPRVLHVEVNKGRQELGTLAQRLRVGQDGKRRTSNKRKTMDSDANDSEDGCREEKDSEAMKEQPSEKEEAEPLKHDFAFLSVENHTRFAPHLTLARWPYRRHNSHAEESEQLRALTQTWQELLSFQVNEIYLMESILPDGVNKQLRYVPLHIQPLKM